MDVILGRSLPTPCFCVKLPGLLLGASLGSVVRRLGIDIDSRDDAEETAQKTEWRRGYWAGGQPAVVEARWPTT